MAKEIKYESTITCPKCGFKSTKRMPTDCCQIAYPCRNCGRILTPKQGTCCVFCSYGDVECPSIQELKMLEG